MTASSASRGLAAKCRIAGGTYSKRASSLISEIAMLEMAARFCGTSPTTRITGTRTDAGSAAGTTPRNCNAPEGWSSPASPGVTGWRHRHFGCCAARRAWCRTGCGSAAIPARAPRRPRGPAGRVDWQGCDQTRGRTNRAVGRRRPAGASKPGENPPCGTSSACQYPRRQNPPRNTSGSVMTQCKSGLTSMACLLIERAVFGSTRKTR